MSLPSVMGHSFSKVPSINIQRSKFDRSHGYKTTFDAGFLVPIFVDEALPGDSLNLRLSVFARLATPLKPVMDNLWLDTFFFFVPNRLIWENWERFNGAQDNPADSVDFTIPQMTVPANGPEVHSLSDYFGWPTDIAAGYSASALWHRGYNLIYNTWFRDQNLQDSVVVDIDDGPDTLTDYVLKRRGKRPDYFTSSLPWPQKGVEISLPLGTTAPVKGIGKFNQTFDGAQADVYETGGTASVSYPLNDNSPISGPANNQFNIIEDPNNAGFPGIFADLSTAAAATINALREAEQLQVMLERDARGGTRYVEILRSHFGVVSPDQRLQRPEYLGGGSSAINIHPTPQQSASAAPPTGVDALGNLAGFGTASFSGHGFNKAFVEHGVIIGLANVRADLTYQQGLNRMFSRSTRYDFFWPALAHLGEQAVLNKEIFLDGSANDDDAFGYQERHAEYRYKPSQITGAFRSTFGTSLDFWHLSQEFGALPTLSTAFIQEEPPVDRVIAVPSEPHILFDSYFKYLCARPMPVYGVPQLGNRL